MDKKRIEIIITSVLVIALLFAWISTFKRIFTRTKKSPSTAQETAQINKDESGQGAVKKPFQDVADNLTWIRCPFSGRIYRSTKKAEGDLKLEGINWDAERPMAVINGIILVVGDEINGKTVMAIEKDSVVLNDGKQNYELPLE